MLGFDLAHAGDEFDGEKPTCTLIEFQVGDWKHGLKGMANVPIESGPKFS